MALSSYRSSCCLRGLAEIFFSLCFLPFAYCVECNTQNRAKGYIWSSGYNCNLISPPDTCYGPNCLPLQIIISAIGMCEPDSGERSYENITLYLILYTAKVLNSPIDNSSIWNIILDDEDKYNCCKIYQYWIDCNDNSLSNILHNYIGKTWYWQPLMDNYNYRLQPPDPLSTSIPVTNSSSTSLVTQTSSVSDKIFSSEKSSHYETYTVSTAAFVPQSSPNQKSLTIGLGFGLGLALLLAIIIIVILLVLLLKERLEKRSVPNPYSSLSADRSNAPHAYERTEPALPAGYYSIAQNPATNGSNVNRNTLYAPSAPYEYVNNGNYQSTSLADNANGNMSQQNKDPSVFYAIVNKETPNQNISKQQ